MVLTPLFQVVPTLQLMWAHGYQVIISYEDISQVAQHSELWPAIPYWWGNKTSGKKLIKYLELRKSGGRPGICCIFVFANHMPMLCLTSSCSRLSNIYVFNCLQMRITIRIDQSHIVYNFKGRLFFLWSRFDGVGERHNQNLLFLFFDSLDRMLDSIALL